MEAKSIQICIPEYKTEMVGGKEVVKYLLRVSCEGKKWDVHRRYNEFDVLKEDLSKKHGGLPSMPGKSLFVMDQQQFLEKRKVGLEQFMRKLVERQDVYANEIFLDFLKFKKHIGDVGLNNIKMIGEVNHNLMGFRDFLLLPEKKLFFCVTSDMNALSRVDSFFTNMTMPWEKKDKAKSEIALSVGVLEVWAQKKGGDDSNYKRLWCKNFASQAICLHYNEQLNVLAAGCDDGTLVVLDYDVNSPMEVEIISEDKAHLKRIMSIWSHSKRKLIYTIGEDGMMKVFDLKAKNVTQEVTVSANKLTYMVCDPTTGFAFIADKAGMIKLYDLNVVSLIRRFSPPKNPPRSRQTLDMSTKSPIRGMDVDFERGRLYVSTFDGNLYRYKFSTPLDEESNIDRAESYKGCDKPRTIKFWQERNEVYVGYGGGRIFVYKADKIADGPLCKLAKIGLIQPDSIKGHDKDVTAMQVLHDRDTIVTASKDKTMKFWIPPKNWKREKGQPEDDEDEYPRAKAAKKTKTVVSKGATKKESAKPVKKQAKLADSDDDSSDGEIVIKKKTPAVVQKQQVQEDYESDEDDDDNVLAPKSKVLSKPVTRVIEKKPEPVPEPKAAPAKKEVEAPVKKAEPVKKAPVKRIYDDEDSSDDYGNWND